MSKIYALYSYNLVTLIVGILPTPAGIKASLVPRLFLRKEEMSLAGDEAISKPCEIVVSSPHRLGHITSEID